ncbi:MAG TPA: M23 family metallopeptidase [Sphingomicrobium sp.]
MSITILLAAAAAQAAPAAAVNPASPLEIRFCPEGRVRSYPLDSLRGLNSLLLQNVAIVNRGSAPLALDMAMIAFVPAKPGQAVDSRIFGPGQLDAAAKSGAALNASGMMKLVAFQFCDGRLLDGATLGSSATLGPGEALLLMQNAFAFKGLPTELRVVAKAGKVMNMAGIPIDGSTSKTQFRWPLPAGRIWLVGAGASFHTTHRWGVPEEFALDIVAVDGAGSSHKADGARNADFLAYGADVLAAADGTVVKVATGASEEAPLLRRPGEALDAYYGRISARQAGNLAKGESAMLGDGVVIDHGNSEYSVYAHLVPGSIRVKAGDRVRSGQPIAKLGSSGNSTEPHLHWQVCDRPSGLSCAGIPPSFVGIDLPAADGPRPIQSGDLVRVAK